MIFVRAIMKTMRTEKFSYQVSSRSWIADMSAINKVAGSGIVAWLIWAAIVLTLPGQTNGPDTNQLRKVEFRTPQSTVYYLEPQAAKAQSSASQQEWIRAWPRLGSTNYVELGSRVVLQIKPGTDISALLEGRALTVSRELRKDLVILQAGSSTAAIDQAASLSQQPGVVACYPVMRRMMRLHNGYAPSPNDPYFPKQWHLENRQTNGLSKGIDLNAREAWATTRGAGVVVAVGDDGVEISHPDLVTRAKGQPHFNFDTYRTNGAPPRSTDSHATAVAGLIAAEGDNSIGVVGLAPEAMLASWVIWGQLHGVETIVSDEALMDMFQHASNLVSVQNHSWGNASDTQQGLDALSDVGISNAVFLGRAGLGEVIVRAAGNSRAIGMDANDDGYANDPRVVAVAATRSDGRVCSYSNPGACVLVSAPSGDPIDDSTEDPAAPNIVTTDRIAKLGYNTNGTGDSLNYCFGGTGFYGTSAAAPQISGVAALILGANPKLSYRDVQQVLIHSARQRDLADPDVHVNGAGFLFSHNQGFGVPDAGFAVALAQHWINRPPATRISRESTDAVDIPTNVLHLACFAPGLTPELSSIICVPSVGPHPDAPMPVLPLVYVGQANTNLTQDLHGKAALIQRGQSFFVDKINRAAEAGAGFVVVFDNIDETNLIYMAGTEFTPIPAVFINQRRGQGIVNFLASHTNLTAQIQLTTAAVEFPITDTLVCEHVGLRLTTTAPFRSDLRITLVSPSGTRSVLQPVNNDVFPGPDNWTYWSVQHFYESSAGNWRLEIANELGADASQVTDAELIIEGARITDTDHDGLDDNWEMRNFGTLAYGPKDNPGQDGYDNARKQCLDLNPTQFDPLIHANVSFWNHQYARMAFPALPNRTYEIRGGPTVTLPFTVLTNLAGQLPEIEIFVPYSGRSSGFVRPIQEPTP
jgi:subtilisin family serine protease/subtilisin-like proprotein convertase family protein